MFKAARSIVATVSASALVFSTAGPVWATNPVTDASPSREACDVGDEAGFRAAIETVTVEALQRGMKTFDYRGIVGEEWRRANLGALVDKQVDVAVEEVRQQTTWGLLIQSLADQNKAEALAKAVADRVYRSDEMKAAIEELAVAVGKNVAQSMEIASQDAARPALACLETYLGSRYGSSVARAVASDAAADFGLSPEAGDASVSTGTVLKRSAGGVAGAAILLVRRQLANMAARVGQRLVGSVLSRLVGTVAGGVGLVLIVKDLWDLRHGVMPIIAEEMKSMLTKEKVQDELARGLEEVISAHVPEIGVEAAKHVVEVWQEFRRAHAKALELAVANPKFRTFLDTLKPDAIPRLDEVVALVLANEGEANVLVRLDNGTLAEAVKRLPEPGMQIARETRSIEAALKWDAIAGTSLPAVVELGLHQRAKPEDFTKPSLDRLLAIDDRLVVQRLAALSLPARDVLFDLDPAQLATLARGHGEAELVSLAHYITALEAGARKQLMDAIAADPARFRAIGPERVRDAIIASRDQAAAIGMMLRPANQLDVNAIGDDVLLVWNGGVHPILLWERHPVAIIAAAGLLVFLMLLLLRLLSPRPRGVRYRA